MYQKKTIEQVTPIAGDAFGAYHPVNQSQPVSIVGLLPAIGYVRLAQIVLDPKRPERPAVVPVSPATLWRWVKAGSFPSPVKLSDHVTAWPVDDIRKWILDRGT